MLPSFADFAGTERFEVRRCLGTGGMGVVYEAFDRERGAAVALKTLRSVSATTIARLKSEFRTLQGLVHPNLVGMGELLEADGQWFFTMELIDGVDFTAYVRPPSDGEPPAVGDEVTLPQLFPGEATPLDEARLRAAALQLARALLAIHAAGITHRDVKPSNVLVTRDDRVVLLDFGLARDARSDGRQSLDTTVGTVAYMAPEQGLGGDAGPPADWYAFGVLLYEALTGGLPHTGQTAFELMMNRQRFPPAPPRAQRPDVPADLDRLCEDLLVMEPGRRPTGEAILARLGSSTASVPASALVSVAGGGPAGVCLGRERELDAIACAFDEMRAGGARAVWIHGPSGVGKSTLVSHAARELADREPELVVLSGRCYERETVPYKALDDVIDALSLLLRRMPAADVAALVPLHASTLPSLFPALGRVPAIAGAPRPRPVMLDPQDQRARAFAALRELILRLALASPVVIAIDDIQWSDADSRLLLSEIMRPPESPPVLLVLCTRTEERAAEAPAAPDLLSAVEGLPVEELAVGPLEPEAATELARSLLERATAGGELGADPGALAAEAGGHPLMLIELARHVLTRTEALPLRLDDAIVARSRVLAPEARRLLELVALAGAPLPQVVIREAAQLEPGVFDAQVALLRAEHLVRTSGARDRDPIEPYHDRVREAVASALDAETRLRHHGALARALETSIGAGDQAQLLVRHWEEAGDPERAAGHARAAAERARQALAFDRAASLLGDALRLGTFPADQTHALRVERALALAAAGHSAAAADEFLGATDGAGPAERLDLERLAAENYLVCGRLDAGLELIEQLLRQVGTSMPRTPGRALRSLLWTRFRVALRGHRFVERHAEEIPRQELARVDLFRAVSMGLSMIDNVRGADFQARYMLATLRAGELVRVGIALGLEITYRASQGGRGLAAAAGLLGELQAIARRTGDPVFEGWVRASEGGLAYFRGRFAEAIEPYAQAEAALRDHTVGTTWERSSLGILRGWSARQAGQLRALRTLYDDTVRDAERRGDQYAGSTVRRSLNRVWLAADDPERARLELERARWMPAEGRFHLQHWFEMESFAEIELYEGSPRTARDKLEEGGAAFRRSLLPRVQIVRVLHTDLHARMLLSEAATAAEPEPLLQRADRLARSLLRERIEYATVLGRLLRAAVATQRGRPEDAVADLRAALRLCEVTGQALQATACRWHLGALLAGDDGAAMSAAAEAWLLDQEIVSPSRLVDLIAPGFQR